MGGLGITIERFFDDPRHRRSEELSFFAERAERTGDLPAGLAQYADAAELEEKNALEVPGEVPRVRGVLAISAVALWLRAGRWDEAARAGCAFLATPDALTPDGRRELQSLVDRARRSSGLEMVLGRDAIAEGIVQVTLEEAAPVERAGKGPSN